MNIMSGNLSTMDICNRLGISLPSDIVEASSKAEAMKIVKELKVHGNPVAEPEFAGIIQKSIKAQEV